MDVIQRTVNTNYNMYEHDIPLYSAAQNNLIFDEVQVTTHNWYSTSGVIPKRLDKAPDALKLNGGQSDGRI